MDRNNRDIQEKIFHLAIEAFRKNVPAQAEIEILAQEPAREIGFLPDRRIKMIIQGKALDYYAEIKTTITKPQKLFLLMDKEKLNYPLLLVTKYVNAQMAEQFRLDGIEFIDTAGNAFIKQPPIYIFIKGNKPPEDVRKVPLKRAFKPAGLKIIYAFLCTPGFENKAYRELAAATDVALGTVGWIMKELKDIGFLLDMGKRGNKLTERENLFQRWVTAYSAVAREQAQERY